MRTPPVVAAAKTHVFSPVRELVRVHSREHSSLAVSSCDIGHTSQCSYNLLISLYCKLCATAGISDEEPQLSTRVLSGPDSAVSPSEAPRSKLWGIPVWFRVRPCLLSGHRDQILFGRTCRERGPPSRDCASHILWSAWPMPARAISTVATAQVSQHLGTLFAG